MSTATYTKESVPKPSKKDWDRVNRIKDSDIDFSDIPEIKDFSGFHAVYKPRKVAVNCKLDADVVAWLKKDGRGYQTRMNMLLRERMEQELQAPAQQQES